jgi:hypothetical protein
VTIRSTLHESVRDFNRVPILLVVHKGGHQQELVPFHVTLRKHVLGNDIR